MTLTQTKPEASTITVYRLTCRETGALVLETLHLDEVKVQQRAWRKMCSGHFQPLRLETQEYRPV